MTSKGTAVLYMATKGERVSRSELRQMESLMMFAQRKGWEVDGALIEHRKPTRSALYTELLEDLRAGKIGEVLEWNEEINLPTTWDHEKPSRLGDGRLGDADGHMHD
ncbi:hypothetical protein [Streptomyces sp. NPDC059468]|uniref:hypothetical protein n=1 Tax=Streptomyces sp. NPDC059468 TaxID=3346845 RepID=UPI0036B60723